MCPICRGDAVTDVLPVSMKRAVHTFIGLANVIKIAQPGLSTRFDFHQGH
jgi:hypothetical protein